MPSLRQLVGVAVLVVVSGTVAGCTGGTGSAGSSPRSAGAAPSGQSTPVTLRFGVYGDPAALASYRELAASYTHRHPKVTVDVQRLPGRPGADGEPRPLPGDGDTPDVFLTDQDDLAGYVAAGAVRPVDELLEARHVEFGDDYQRVGLEAFSAGNALQCMPAEVSPLVVFYNKDLLRFAPLAAPGQPAPRPALGWSWQQFVRAARQISHGQVKGVYFKPTLEDLMPLVRSAGSDVVDDPRTPTRLTLEDGGTRDALRRVLGLARDPRLSPTPAQLARQGAVSRFEHGRLGMLLGTRALVPRLRAAHGLRFDVMPLPSLGEPRTISEIAGYCLSARSRHVDRAADFIAYAAGDQGARILARTGATVPANLLALHSPAFTQPGREPEHPRVFSDAAHLSDAPPYVASWPRMRAGTQPLVDRMYGARRPDLDRLLPRLDRESASLLRPPAPN